jgi:Zn-finger nucleic acid-binding protein
MKCPTCNVNLQMTERQGIEIDYCPQCRGVWLDRGELDKIIERSAAREAEWDEAPASREEHGRHKGYGGPHKHKKKSLRREIFDFG